MSRVRAESGKLENVKYEKFEKSLENKGKVWIKSGFSGLYSIAEITLKFFFIIFFSK